MNDTAHHQAREKASEFAVRSLNECPFYEGMLKVESHGEQRVRQLLYSQVQQRFPHENTQAQHT